jgi:hypothetical protein
LPDSDPSAYPTLVGALKDPDYVFAAPSNGSPGKRPELVGTRVATSLTGLAFKTTPSAHLNFLSKIHLANIVYAAQSRYIETVASDFKDLVPLKEHFVPYYMEPNTLDVLIKEQPVLSERMLDNVKSATVTWVE